MRKNTALLICFISGISLLVIVFICLLSLISYNPYDQSPWFSTTTYVPPTNWLGSIGAIIAAFLIQIGDVASYGLLVILALNASVLLRPTLWRRFVPKMIGVVLLSCCLMLYEAFTNYSWYPNTVPGGVGARYLMYLFSSIPQYVLPICIFWGALIASVLLFLKPMLLLLRFIMYYFPIRVLKKCAKSCAHFLQCMYKAAYTSCAGLVSGTLIQEAGGVVSFENLVHEIVAQEEEKREQEQTIQMNLDVASDSLLEKEPYATANLLNENKQTSSPEIVARNLIYDVPVRKLFADFFSTKTTSVSDDAKKLAERLEQKLERFGIQGRVVGITPGPVITFFEYEPHIDAKISKIVALEDDLSLALEALSVRIIAPVPGTAVVGFEVANKKREQVSFAEIVASDAFTQARYWLPLALGKDVKGESVVVDLAAMPHLLVAGSTGSGKSVLLNVMLASLLCKKSPKEVQLVLIDPKRLEFNAYAHIPHLATPVVTDIKQARSVLKWVVCQMQDRYCVMEQLGVKSIEDYNQMCIDYDLEKLPALVVVIDELADLMMTAGKEVESLIVRIAQMARAAGIHMIVATQRPSVDVITGLLKVNFASRIACRVISKIDSRTVLDVSGAQKLLGRGDMLFLQSNGLLKRVHGAYLARQELMMLIAHLKQYGAPEYAVLEQEIASDLLISDEHDEELYQRVLAYLHSVETISVSLLQRHFRIGYNRSARLVDRLQAEGILVHEPGGKLKRVVRAALVVQK